MNTNRLLKQIIILPVLHCLSYYSFINTSVFNIVSVKIGSPLTTFFAVYGIILILALLMLLLKKQVVNIFYKTCIVLYIPAILSFSKIDLVQQLSFIEISSKLSSSTIIIIGTIIFTGIGILCYADINSKLYQNISLRGGNDDELKLAFKKQEKAIFSTFSMIALVVLIFFLLSDKLKFIFSNLLTYVKSIPSIFAMIGILIASICLFFSVKD